MYTKKDAITVTPSTWQHIESIAIKQELRPVGFISPESCLHTHTHNQKKIHKVLHTSDFQHNLRSTETTDRGQDRRVHERTEDGGRTDDSPSGRLSEKLLSNIVKIGLLSGSFSPSEQWVLGHGSTSYAHILHLVLYYRSNELPHALSNQHKRS